MTALCAAVKYINIIKLGSVLNLNLWVIPGQIVANTVIDSGIPFFLPSSGSSSPSGIISDECAD